MNTPIGHIVSIAAVRATSQPIARAWCTCGRWEYRCSRDDLEAVFARAKEHAIQANYTPPVGDRHRPNPCLTAKEGC